MDTQAKILELQTLSNSLKSEASDILAKAESTDTAISQLQGVLATQATALELQYQSTIDQLTIDKNNLITEKSVLQTRITELEALIPIEEPILPV